MNCSQCQAELPDSATFCPRCGTSTRQNAAPAASFSTPATYTTPTAYMSMPMSTPPQTVAQGSAVPAPSRVAHSYLPTGAPPWPTSVPQELLRKADPAEGSTPVVKDERKRGRFPRSTLLVATLLVLTPLLGAGITLGVLFAKGELGNASAQPARVVTVPSPTAAATTTPSAQSATPATSTNSLPTPTSFQTTSNRDVNVSFKYPADWIADAPTKSSSNTYFDVHPKQQLGITFIVARFSDSTSSSIQNADQINSSNLSSLNVSNIQPVTPPNSQPTIGGEKWSEQDATFSDNSGNKIHFVTIAVEHKKQYYNIAFFMPEVYYSEAMQKYMQPILESFVFLS